MKNTSGMQANPKQMSQFLSGMILGLNGNSPMCIDPSMISAGLGIRIPALVAFFFLVSHSINRKYIGRPTFSLNLLIPQIELTSCPMASAPETFAE